jgi:predicted amidophosphoribosyltransferase
MRLQIRDLQVRAVSPLNAMSLSWIKRVKFARLLSERDYRQLKSWGQEALKEWDLEFDSISSVPSHPLRSLVQVDLSWEWARCLAEVSGIALLSPGLRHSSVPRSMLRQPQKSLSLSERRALFASQNRQPRYVAHPTKIHRRVLLVDDVINSGCSFLEAREALEASGHRVIGGLVLAGGFEATSF